MIYASIDINKIDMIYIMLRTSRSEKTKLHRKPTNFINFHKSLIKDFKRKNPKKKVIITDLAKEAGLKWKTMSKDEKQKYVDDSDQPSKCQQFETKDDCHLVEDPDGLRECYWKFDQKKCLELSAEKRQKVTLEQGFSEIKKDICENLSRNQCVTLITEVKDKGQLRRCRWLFKDNKCEILPDELRERATYQYIPNK